MLKLVVWSWGPYIFNSEMVGGPSPPFFRKITLNNSLYVETPLLHKTEMFSILNSIRVPDYDYNVNVVSNFHKITTQCIGCILKILLILYYPFLPSRYFILKFGSFFFWNTLYTYSYNKTSHIVHIFFCIYPSIIYINSKSKIFSLFSFQRLLACLTPSPEWGPALEENRILYKKSLATVSSNFPQKNVSGFGHSASSPQMAEESDLCMAQKDESPNTESSV